MFDLLLGALSGLSLLVVALSVVLLAVPAQGLRSLPRRPARRASLLRRLRRQTLQIVVAICGPSGSGKSTLAACLAHLLPGRCTILPLDACLIDRDQRPPDLTGIEAFKAKYALSEAAAALRKLLSGVPVRICAYNQLTHRRDTDMTFLPAETIIVEGTRALDVPGLESYPYCISIYVECPDPEGNQLLRARTAGWLSGQSPEEQLATALRKRWEEWPVIVPQRDRCTFVLHNSGAPFSAAELRPILDCIAQLRTHGALRV